MRIGLNGERLLEDNPAGPEKYTYNIYNSLAKVDTKNDYTVYLKKQPSDIFFNKLTRNNSKFNFKIVNKSISWTQYDLAKELLKNPVDIFFTPVHTIPFFHNPKLKIISMIHGLEYKKNQEKTSFRSLVYPFILWATLTFSSFIVTPSSATLSKIKRLRWPFIKKKKIKTVHEGVSETFFRATDSNIKSVKERYGLDKTRYLIFVSTIQPRKNIPGMVEAFALALKEIADTNVKLVLCGKLGWNYEESVDSPRKLGIENKVKFLGRVPDEDLPGLLKGSCGFVNFSFEEGFGLPLLEAMAGGVQCAVSDIPAYRELGAQVPIYADPTNTYSMKRAFIDILTKPKIENRIAAGINKAQNYSWEKSAKELLLVFEHLIKNF